MDPRLQIINLWLPGRAAWVRTGRSRRRWRPCSATSQSTRRRSRPCWTTGRSRPTSTSLATSCTTSAPRSVGAISQAFSLGFWSSKRFFFSLYCCQIKNHKFKPGPGLTEPPIIYISDSDFYEYRYSYKNKKLNIFL